MRVVGFALGVAAVLLGPTPRVLGQPSPWTYETEMKRGRELVAANELAGAATAFANAVAAGVADSWLHGEALAALAGVEEARGESAAAIHDYRAAYQERPTEDIRERLARLDPAAARALNPFQAHLMAGPYASVDAFCDEQREEFEKARKRLPGVDVPEYWTYVCDDELVTLTRTDFSKPAPDPTVRLFESVESVDVDGEHGHFTTTFVGVEHHGQWYIAPLFDFDNTRKQHPRYQLEFSTKETLNRRGQGVTVIGYHKVVRATDVPVYTTTVYIALIAVGTFDRPSIIPDIAVDQGVAMVDRDWPTDTAPARWRLLPTGEIEISPPKPDTADVENVVIPGKHLLRFP